MSQHPDLPAEQARNTEYLAALAAKPPPAAGVSVARSRRWVDPTHVKGASRAGVHPLVGRLGFDAVDEFLGRACYIGPTRLDAGDLQVVSWDAPVSRLHFYGRDDARATVDGELAVRRTFDHLIDDIADLDDEWFLTVEPSPFAAELVVPAPAPAPQGRSGRSRRSRPTSTQAGQPRVPLPAVAAAPAQPAPTVEARPAPPAQGADEAAAAPVAPIGDRGPTDRLSGMRAAETVLRKLAAPRSDALKSVLATLQPDQFDVVASPVSDDLIVQGHPGTGKTVVAAYRAAYLVSPERAAARASNVLLVGPTPEYVGHVRGLLAPLDPEGRVVAAHIAQVLDNTVGIKGTWAGGIGGEHDKVDPLARRFAERAEALVREHSVRHTGANARREHIKAVYELVRANGAPLGASLSDRPAEVAWMRGLPPFGQAVKLRRYLPLLAQITLAFQPVPHTDRFDHIVVDEAQDVSPIEWNVLDQHLRRPQGRWTLVGDLNQRRSDTTYATWAEISDHLGLGHGDQALRPTVLRRGYRSTTAILRFADKLLPTSQRGASSIQDGPAPSVTFVRTAVNLPDEAVRSARSLLAAHPGGTVAIITVDPGAMITHLGKQGWRRGETHNVWAREGETLRLFVPEMARGLEFDGVVVVEPGAFPETLGRDGQLYTSLTRANRELAVVWHQDLPDALRRAGRSGRA